MTASTLHDSRYHPYYGRLNENRGNRAWCTKTTTDRTDYLQVDMGSVRFVCAVATQGSPYERVWTSSFKVHFSTDGVIWIAYKENDEEKVNYSKSVNKLNLSDLFFSLIFIQDYFMISESFRFKNAPASYSSGCQSRFIQFSFI